MANEKAKEITLGADFGAVAVIVNGKRIEVSADGVVEIKPANSNTMTAIAAAQEAYKIGDRLREGNLNTVIFGFDENNDPLRVPESIFIGKTDYDDQDGLVARENKIRGLQGSEALTRLSDKECEQLKNVWDKVAPRELQGSAAPWFWGASYGYLHLNGRVWRGGAADWGFNSRHVSRPVPVALRGPARS